MFTTLPHFYNSQEWRLLRQQIIHERTQPDGFVYDELHHKPIVNGYDLVAHHKIPLTAQNMNDYTISLNPENIMLVSQRSHNEIHKRFGFAYDRKVYYVYGAPCSGKTTFVNEIKGDTDLVIDMDNIWQCITGAKRYEKPAELKSIAFGVRDCLYDMVKTRAGRWNRAFVIAGGALQSERERTIEALGAEPIFVDTDKETCIQRLTCDDTRTSAQKAEWLEYINQWFETYGA